MAEKRVNTVLAGVTVAIPETRQRDIMAAMLLSRGANVEQIPMVAIHDSPHQATVLAWLERFIAEPPDMLILLTGEGLRRLLALSDMKGLRDDFITALARVQKLCRGPKPEQVLKEISLEADLRALEPTTEGVIATLSNLKLKDMSIGVQLYGEEPNLRLIDYLKDELANVQSVAPYIYASKEEESRVLEFIHHLASGTIQVLAFTSQSQVKRLHQVAKSGGIEETLLKGMSRTVLAAVGPVVRDMLIEQGYRVEIMPERVYFMKPLVAAIENYYRNSAKS